MSLPAHKDPTIAPAEPARRRLPRIVALTIGLSALALLIVQLGFAGEVTPALHGATLALAVLFAIEQAQSWRVRRHRPSWVRRETLLLGVALTVLATMLVLALAGWIDGHENKVSLLAHVIVQTVVLATLTLRGLRHQARLTAVALRPGWLLIGSFGLIIVAGACMLKLPRAVASGEHLTWLDAFFTSTSAVCVTGLAVHNTADFFTPTGQIIIIALVQTGGLGIMTLTFFVTAILFQGMSLHDRMLLGEMIAEKRLAHVGQTLKFIVIFTFTTEAVGALAIYFCLPADHAPGERAFQAVFHSISAFCNAGFTTLPNGLADNWVHDLGVLQMVIMLIVTMGGLGSLPVYDTLHFAKNRTAWIFDRSQPRPRLRVHTRVVWVMTLGLLLGGGVTIFVSEFVLYDGYENGGKWITAFFHSNASRTAGFNTVDMGHVGPVTVHLLVMLMLIGGSPGGTAGGVRTTVVAVATLHLWNQLRGIPHLVLFRRRLSPEMGSRALGILVLATGWLFVNFAILRQLQPHTADTRLMFELVSAFATVGLSLNLTPELTSSAKILIIANMFIGRLGLFTLATTLMPRARKRIHTHPQEDILLV